MPRRPVLLLAATLVCSCAKGEDSSEVGLTIYEEPVSCDRNASVDATGHVVTGDSVATDAILSRAGSRFTPGAYLYAGSFRGTADSGERPRYFELELDVPTARTGATGVEAQYREYLDREPVFESVSGSGEVRLILDDKASSPPAGRFDLSFVDDRGNTRRVIGSFHRPEVPPISDAPITEQGDAPREQVYVDYDTPPDDWDLYLDYGCGTDPEPPPDPDSGGGGCEGDTGGGESAGDGCEGGDESGDGCEGDTGGTSSGGDACEGDTGGGGGCEGDTGGGSGCEGDSCAVAPAGAALEPARARRLRGRLFPYALTALGLWLTRRRR